MRVVGDIVTGNSLINYASPGRQDNNVIACVGSGRDRSDASWLGVVATSPPDAAKQTVWCGNPELAKASERGTCNGLHVVSLLFIFLNCLIHQPPISHGL
jgi:hypothetical protein